MYIVQCTLYMSFLCSLCWPTTLIWWKLFLMTPLALHCGCNDGRTRHHWQLRLLNWATRSSRAMAARWQLCFCIVFHWGRAAQSHYLPPLLLIDSPHRHNLPSNKHYFIQTGFPAEKAFNCKLDQGQNWDELNWMPRPYRNAGLSTHTMILKTMREVVLHPLPCMIIWRPRKLVYSIKGIVWEIYECVSGGIMCLT